MHPAVSGSEICAATSRSKIALLCSPREPRDWLYENPQKPHFSAACSRKQNDAAALFEIYSMYNSYFRSDVNEPQLVKRAEARRSTSPGCPASQCAAENAHAKLVAPVIENDGNF
jgi:hypothetical protein